MTNAIEKVSPIAAYLQKQESVQQFIEILGDKEAQPYIKSVLIAVSDSQDLMDCTPKSIFRAALRAASLGLSCDPAVKQAWLLPFDVTVKERKIKRDGQTVTIPEHTEKQAQFHPHYMGLYNLAMRTGQYWIIHVGPIYEGQKVLEDVLTGKHVVEENGFVGEPQAANPAYRDVTIRRSQGKKIIGWIGYFKTKNGFEKSVYMSLIEIAEHAEKHARGYRKNANWNDPKKRETMEMKTVLRALLNWADKTGIVEHTPQLREALNADEADFEPGDDAIDVTPTDVTEEKDGDKVEMTDPLHKDAVVFAAGYWNISTQAAKKAIEKAIADKKLKNPMPKDDFKKWVANPQGEPEPA